MIPLSHLLIISSPNDGGLLTINDRLEYKMIDDVSTTGICFNDEMFVRSIQRQEFSELQFFHKDGRFHTTIEQDISDIHDLLLIDNSLYVVSTGSNELVCYGLQDGTRSRYKFPGNGDAWHLNCLDVWNGEIVVSAFGEFSEDRGYKGKTQKSGFVFELGTQKKLYTNLSQPHSPKNFDGHGYICDSETKRLLVFRNGELTTEINFDAYTRGLFITDQCIYMGLNNSRNVINTESTASIVILDRTTLEVINRIYLPINEIYDIKLIEKTQLDAFNILPDSSLYENIKKDLQHSHDLIQHKNTDIEQKNQELENVRNIVETLKEELILKEKNLVTMNEANLKLVEHLYTENNQFKVDCIEKDRIIIQHKEETLKNRNKLANLEQQLEQYKNINDKKSFFQGKFLILKKGSKEKQELIEQLQLQVENLKLENISLQNLAQHHEEKSRQYWQEKNHFEQWLSRENESFVKQIALSSNEIEMLNERNIRLSTEYENTIRDLRLELKRIYEQHHMITFEFEQLKKQLEKG